jgi:hypothetical protein
VGEGATLSTPNPTPDRATSEGSPSKSTFGWWNDPYTLKSCRITETRRRGELPFAARKGTEVLCDSVSWLPSAWSSA